MHRTDNNHHNQHQQHYFHPSIVLPFFERHPERLPQMPDVEEVPDKPARLVRDFGHVQFFRLLNLRITIIQGDNVKERRNRKHPIKPDFFVQNPTQSQTDGYPQRTKDIDDADP